MFYSRSIFVKTAPALLALILAVLSPIGIQAQNTTATEKTGSGSQAGEASTNPPAGLLPVSVAGLQSTSDVKEFQADNLHDLSPEMESIFREYRVIAAASRDYGRVKVEVFQTQNQFAAFGLFSFFGSTTKNQPGTQPVGSGSANTDKGFVFWKANVFVRLKDTAFKPTNAGRPDVSSASVEKLARVISEAIVSTNAAVKYPPLLDSLPPAAKLPGSEQYFLGPESLNADVAHGREIFEFVGETEAVTADYQQGPAAAIGTPASPSLKLIIVECHTPEFATDELARVTGYVSSLPENEQQQIAFKRTGNYIIAAVNVREREFAEGLINSIQYPYTVKWLRNPLWPTNDPFRAQKAAQMLLSTFGLLGLIILTVIVGGSIFGASVFLRRRKQQREIFSDAGGMLRLDIEPFVLALPPKRDK
jgi:Family of unknown function (DUF6599)